MSAHRVETADATKRDTPRGGAEVERLQEDIKATRAELGATVEALAAKVDVKTRARRRVVHVRERTSLRARRAMNEASAAGIRARERTSNATAVVAGRAGGADARTAVIVAGAALAGFALYLALSRWWRR